MGMKIKIPKIVKTSFVLVITESVVAVIYSVYVIIASLDCVKWLIPVVFGFIMILLHIMIIVAARLAVSKSIEKYARGLGLVMALFSFVFLRFVLHKGDPKGGLSLAEIITMYLFFTFYLYNGIILIYWASVIKKLKNIQTENENELG